MRGMALLEFRERREWGTTIASLVMSLKISHVLRVNLCVKSDALSFTSAYLSLFSVFFPRCLISVTFISS
jgi:hypothetical protein